MGILIIGSSTLWEELEKILKEKGKPDPSWLLRSQDENEQKKRVEIEEIRKQIEFAKISPETFANIKIATSTICEKFEVIDTEEKLEELINEIKQNGEVAIDLEHHDI